MNSFGNTPEWTRCKYAVDDIKSISKSVELYHQEHKIFPSLDEGLVTLVDLGYIKVIPIDPWNRPYKYRLHSSDKFEVITTGKDGLKGGTGKKADYKSGDNTSDYIQGCKNDVWWHFW